MGWRIYGKRATTWTNLLSYTTLVNKSELLNSRLEQLLLENREDEHGQWWVEYRPFAGWYALPDYPRYFGDDGVFLGKNYQDALKQLEFFFV